MLKKIITYIINLFFIICVFALSSLLILSNTILSKQYVIGILEKNNYYEKTYYDIQEGFKNYIMQAGLEESILEDLYDREKINHDINMVIDAIYENKKINIDTQVMKKTLDDRINNVLNENNRTPDAEEKEAIQTFENTIVEVYTDGIAYSQKYVEQIANIFPKLQSVLKKAEIGCAIIITILFITILVINKNVKEELKTIGIALLANGILNISIKLLIGNRIHNILILNKAFSESLISLIDAVINSFCVTGIIMTIIGIIGIVVGSINKSKENKIRKY